MSINSDDYISVISDESGEHDVFATAREMFTTTQPGVADQDQHGSTVFGADIVDTESSSSGHHGQQATDNVEQGLVVNDVATQQPLSASTPMKVSSRDQPTSPLTQNEREVACLTQSRAIAGRAQRVHVIDSSSSNSMSSSITSLTGNPAEHNSSGITHLGTAGEMSHMIPVLSSPVQALSSAIIDASKSPDDLRIVQISFVEQHVTESTPERVDSACQPNVEELPPSSNAATVSATNVEQFPHDTHRILSATALPGLSIIDLASAVEPPLSTSTQTTDHSAKQGTASSETDQIVDLEQPQTTNTNHQFPLHKLLNASTPTGGNSLCKTTANDQANCPVNVECVLKPSPFPKFFADQSAGTSGESASLGMPVSSSQRGDNQVTVNAERLREVVMLAAFAWNMMYPSHDGSTELYEKYLYRQLTGGDKASVVNSQSLFESACGSAQLLSGHDQSEGMRSSTKSSRSSTPLASYREIEEPLPASSSVPQTQPITPVPEPEVVVIDDREIETPKQKKVKQPAEEVGPSSFLPDTSGSNVNLNPGLPVLEESYSSGSNTPLAQNSLPCSGGGSDDNGPPRKKSKLGLKISRGGSSGLHQSCVPRERRRNLSIGTSISQEEAPTTVNRSLSAGKSGSLSILSFLVTET